MSVEVQAGMLGAAGPARALADARHYRWADLIRVVGIALVVLLHCEAVPNTQFGHIQMAAWWQTNIYASFVCVSVPLFVMLSGALILNQDRWDGSRFLRRRVQKLLLPLIVWTLIYALWYKFGWMRPLSLKALLVHFLAGISDPLFAHLWFLYIIISLYLMVPILRVFFRHSSPAQQAYFIALWFVATGVKPLIAKLFGIDLGLYLDPFFGFIGYFLLGATIARFLPERLSRPALAIVGLLVSAGFLTNLIGTYALSVRAGKLDDYLYEHIAPTVMVMSSGVFVLLRHCSLRLGTIGGSLERLGRLTFGIYLSHALIIVLLESGFLGFRLNETMLPPIAAAPLFAVAVLVLSAIFTAVLRATPLLRTCVP